MIRVLIVDDHGVVRAGLTQLLATFADVDVVGTAANGREAVALAIDLQPDVVLMDLEMPEVDGIQATADLQTTVPSARVVVLTSFSDRPRILAAINAGAVGYLLKDADPAELEAGLRAASRGESPLDSRAATALVGALSNGQPPIPLSKRELEVIRLVGEGLPNKLIAHRLEISEKTVKAHLTSIFRQIDVTDRTQAALWAQRNGLLGERGRL